VTDSALFRLVHAQARERAKACIDNAPDGYVVTVKEPTRSGEANAALHARLGEIAERVEWAGKRQTIETWKRLLVAAWSRATGEPLTVLPALDGHGIDVVWRRTSQLSRREMSDLLEYVNAWCAEQPAMQEIEA
jgi:hypothetical protein